MTKGELIKAVVAKKPSRTRSGEVEDIINTTLNEIKASLVKGSDVKIGGFGTFKVEHKAARPGRNPRTGADLVIPPRDVIKFKSSKELKESMK
jgi:nucleoid DNA-binding protein